MSGAGGSEVEARVRAYLGVLLPPDEVDDAATAACAADDPFAAAHEVVGSRVRVTTEVEADVLVEEAGLPAAQAAAVLGLSEDEVRAALDAAREAATELAGQPAVAVPPAPASPPIVIVDDSGEPYLLPEPPSGRRRRFAWVVLAVVALAAVAVALAVVARGGDCEATVHDVAAAPIEVRGGCVASDVDATGRPAEPRDRFEIGEPIVFWFSYAPVDAPEFFLTLAVVRDGEELPTMPQFPLPDDCDGETCTFAHLRLPTQLVGEPGRYRVQIRFEGRVLVSGAFEVTA